MNLINLCNWFGTVCLLYVLYNLGIMIYPIVKKDLKKFFNK